MSRPTVIMLDKDFHSIADLSEWVDDFQKSYHWMDPKHRRDTFGFSNKAPEESGRTANLELRPHPISEKLLACRNEKVYAAVVVDNRLSRWEMLNVSIATTGRWSLRLTQMNPYTEALLREMLAVGAHHIEKPSAPEIQPQVILEAAPKTKKRSRK